MTPFKASLPGRIISFSIALALIAGGLIPILGLNPGTWVPMTLLFSIGACIAGTVLSVQDYARWAGALLVALPLVLWPYSMVLIEMTTHRPQFAWLFLAAGGVVTALAVAGFFARSTASAAALAKHSVA